MTAPDDARPPFTMVAGDDSLVCEDGVCAVPPEDGQDGGDD